MSDTPESENLKSITEDLYKQNLELAVKNKTFSLLRKLYQISILSLEPDSIAIKIVETVRETLEFELVGILMFDQDNKNLVPLKFDLSPRLKQAEGEAGYSLEKATIVDPKQNTFINKVLDNDESHTDEISLLWKGLVPENVLKLIGEKSNIKNLSAYPLVIDNKIIGVFVICLNRAYEKLTQYEKDSINSLVDVTSIAIDRAKLYQALKISNEGQENLIHVMNHQIKGYLSKSRNIFSELYTNPYYGVTSDKAKPMLEEGFKSLTDGVRFVQDILMGSSAQSGALQYNMQPVDFKSLVQDAIEKQKPKAQEKGLSYEVDLNAGDFNITGDALQLSEALRNLIDNSIIYTQMGGLKISLTTAQNKLLFAVKDTGIGINPEDKQRLFTKGGRGKESIKVNVNSSGYGLAFVKAVVDAHKGRVWAESAGSGHGSQFYIELPTTTS